MAWYSPTPAEVHAGVWVKRDDLIGDEMPNGKVRGVLPYLEHLWRQGHRRVVNVGASHSNSHALAAWCGRRLGLEVHTVVNVNPATPVRPNLALAADLEATVHTVGASHLSVLRARARQIAADLDAPLLPWAFIHPEVAAGIGSALDEVGEGFVHVVPVGSGAYLSGIVAGLDRLGRADRVVGVAGMGLRPSLRDRIEHLTWPRPVELYDPRERSTTPTPWPSDPHYEWQAWPTARLLADQGERVLFWSVGRPAPARWTDERGSAAGAARIIDEALAL